MYWKPFIKEYLKETEHLGFLVVVLGQIAQEIVERDGVGLVIDFGVSGICCGIHGLRGISLGIGTGIGLGIGTGIGTGIGLGGASIGVPTIVLLGMHKEII